MTEDFMVILERITLAYFLSILKGKQVSDYQTFPKERLYLSGLCNCCSKTFENTEGRR